MGFENSKAANDTKINISDHKSVPAPGNHGGDASVIEKALGFEPGSMLDLSATLNPLAPSVGKMLESKLDEALGRYPDATYATACLAEVLEVPKEQLLLTNGGAEAIALVAGELESAAVVDPEFSLWRRHLPKVDSQAGRVRSNPHSPTGHLAASNEVAACWDEAFYPLATGTWTRSDFNRGSFVVGSLTKLYACPGLRLGYVVAPNVDTARRLALRQPAWSVNGLATEILPDLLACTDIEKWSIQLAELKRQMVSLIQEFGLSANWASAPWILIEDAPWLRDALALRGVLVRDCANFGMPGTVRLAVADGEGLKRLRKALVNLDWHEHKMANDTVAHDAVAND